jgi:hypothetical protein
MRKENKMKILNLFLTVISIALLCVSMLAGTADAGTQIWDFEKADQEKEWNVATGKWGIEDGVYQETSGATAAMASFVGEEDWTDYTVEAKIRIEQSNWAGLIFRAKSDLEYYVLYFGVGATIELWRHKPPNVDSRDNIFNIPQKGVGAFAAGEWYTLRAVVEGDEFQLFVNDELQNEVVDAVYDAGRIGVWAWQATASFDDVTVTGDGIKDTTAVNPDKKLAITWGKLRVDY